MSSNGGVKAKWTNKGRVLDTPSLKGSEATKTLRMNSFTYKSRKLFNSLPQEVRDFGGADTTVNQFKAVLDDYLSKVPDQPRDLVNGFLPAATDPNTGQISNSIEHWRKFLQKSNPEYNWN